jgi:hypothetical protein
MGVTMTESAHPPGDGPPTPTSTPHRRNWFFAAVLAALTAAVVQVLTGAFTTAWSWFLGVITDEQPVQIARYTKTPIVVQNYVIPRPAGDFPPPPTGNHEKQAEWAADLGGVDANFTEVRVTVTGSSTEPVILHDLRINVTDRGPPLGGTYVVLGGGDITPVRWLMVDLDASPPEITESVDGRPILADLYPKKYEEQPEDPVTFPYKVSATEPEVFYLVAETKRCYCEWTAELLWTTGESEGSTIIDDDGKPFRTTSTRNATATCYAGQFGPELMC